MPLNAQDASVAVFVRGLDNLRVVLTEGEAHGAAAGLDPAELLRAELAPGMYNLAVQAHWAAEAARLAVERLIGAAAVPDEAGEATSFAELYDRIDRVIAYLGTVDGVALEAGLARTIQIPHRGGTMTFAGTRFLQEFAVPSFFFHLTLAYAILRHKGVHLTKGHFLGPMG